jgi:hypothetical protein
VTDLWIKQGVVRALATPEARGIAGAPLIAEFLRLPFSGEGTPAQESLKWAIANTLAIVAAPAEFQHLKAILGDSRHGKSREMVALAIAASGVPAAAELLCVSLADPQIAGHCLKALNMIRASCDSEQVSKLAEDKRAWVRREAKQLAKRSAR